jgi:probable rRNA maturation factor
MPVTVRVQYGAGLTARPDAAGSQGPDRAAIRRLLARAARAALRDGAVTAAEISVTLFTDPEIAELNERFLSHGGPTDVISFPLHESGEDVVGDIYIGYERVLRQAADEGVAVAEELVRVTVHGVLHVLGHDHPDGSERTESEMWAIQERIVARVMAA